MNDGSAFAPLIDGDIAARRSTGATDPERARIAESAAHMRDEDVRRFGAAEDTADEQFGFTRSTLTIRDRRLRCKSA